MMKFGWCIDGKRNLCPRETVTFSGFVVTVPPIPPRIGLTCDCDCHKTEDAA